MLPSSSAPNPAGSTRTAISRENYAFLQAEVYRDSGIVLDETKTYLMEARLMPLVIQHQLKNIDQLCARLRDASSAPLRQSVVEAMTTNETLFFRDSRAFEALQNEVFPELIRQRSSSRRLTIWSAASSSGQEAYSVAMMLLEIGVAGWEIRVSGTDLNRQILDRARAGRYVQIEVDRGLPAPYLAKYFRKVGSEWQIADQVRRMVDFAPFDLRASMAAIGPFDLILCRNVLIYFDGETKSKILSGIRQVLAPDGLLLLGGAESLVSVTSLFAPAPRGSAIFYRAA